MELVVSPGGRVSTIYSEVLDLTPLGRQQITRASHVEPDAQGLWLAQIIDGPRLGPFGNRSEAIAAEVIWLQQHRLRRT